MEAVSTENGTKKTMSVTPVSRNVYWLQTFQSSLNLLAHILIGFVVGANLIYSFRLGLPLRTTPLHIVLCVIGYQLLMAESILSLCPYNGWSAHLRLVDKKRAHWILQIVGSALAMAGSFIMSMTRRTNWNSLHGKFALVAVVFTTISLVNGLTSLWAYEIRKVVPIPGKLSKVTHILFGIIAFASATISLCYGYEYVRSYFGDGVTETLIALTATFTAIILINPCITLAVRILNK